MRIALLSCGAMVIRTKEQSWLFGVPDGTKEALDQAGIEIPSVVFTTSLRSPGFGKLGKPVMAFKEQPLRMNGLQAEPIERKHGTDYVIKSADGSILFSERGDVSVEDTRGYSLAIVKNKHLANGYGDNVISWPWPEVEFHLKDGLVTKITSEVKYKVWSEMEQVPDNLKKIDGTALSLDQANFIARVAKASAGDDGKENWAIAISSFKKSYIKKDGNWVRRKNLKELEGMLHKYSALFSAKFPNGINDYKYVNDVDLSDNILIVDSNGITYGVGFSLNSDGSVEFAPQTEWVKLHQTWEVISKQEAGAIDERIDQVEANYRQQSDDDLVRCSTCKFYQSDGGACELVTGFVLEYGVCDLWESNEYPENYTTDTYVYMGEVVTYKEELRTSDGRIAGDHLIVGDKKKVTTWHLPVKTDGKPDRSLMGAAAAALTHPNGYRGNKYEGPDKSEAIRKLVAIYRDEKAKLPKYLKQSYERLKEYNSIIDRIKALGGRADEIISIAVAKSEPEAYYVNFGDWAEDTTIKAVKDVLGSDIEYNSEAPPDESKYKIIWQYGKRKELVEVEGPSSEYKIPVKRFGDIITAALHTAYNDTADHYFSEGYLSQDERLAVAQAVGPALTALRTNLPEELLNRDVTMCTNVPAKLKELAPNVPDTIEDSWLTVYKSDNDQWRWATISSIAVWDRQQELFSTKAMDWAIAFNKLIGNKGPLRYKHIPGMDGGMCDTQIRVGEVLFESGTFDDTPLGLAMRSKLKEEPGQWQISLGLAFAKGDIVNGYYNRAAIFERSMTKRPALPTTTIISS